MIRGALLLLLASTLAAVATHLWHPAAPLWYLAHQEAGQNEVTLAEIKQRWNNQVLWVDARTEARYAAGHQPEAILINEFNRSEQVFANLDKLQVAAKPIIVYCDGQKCEASHKIRDYLAENVGLPEVWVLTGGWQAIEQAK